MAIGIDPTRHLDVFSPHAFGNKRIDVIGCGATGSRIILSLAKLGISNIHVWDFDHVEEHNIANQAYTLSDIGRLKGEAIKDIVKQSTGTDITFHLAEATGKERFGEVVFMLTDTMSSRKNIWDKAIKYQPVTKLLIETRMGADTGRIYTIDPCKRNHIQRYEETLYEDEVVTEVSACGASTTVGATAEMISGLAVWQMMRWFAIEYSCSEDQLENELIISTRPTLVLSNSF